MKSLQITNPVIYLDFDGVLHPDSAYKTLKGIVLKNYPGHKLFENCDLLSAMLQPYPNVKIVLSTSWVKELRFSHARKRLPSVLANRVIGATWHTRMDHRVWENLTRYQQVQQHATRHNVATWIALDDDTDDWHPRAMHHVIPCDTCFGFNTIDRLNKFQEWLTSTKFAS